MTRVLLCTVLALFLLDAPAMAQSSVYAGASSTAVTLDASSPSLDTLGTFAAVGGFVGFRFHDAWSIELHLDRGFGESTERERLEGFGRAVVQDRVGRGFSLFGVWKPAIRRRVGAAVAFGISTRAFETHVVRTIVTNPADPSLAGIGEPRREGGAGWAGGAFFPIHLAGGWTLAPEVRVAMGLTGERGGYVLIAPGGRIMFGF